MTNQNSLPSKALKSDETAFAFFQKRLLLISFLIYLLPSLNFWCRCGTAESKGFLKEMQINVNVTHRIQRSHFRITFPPRTGDIKFSRI